MSTPFVSESGGNRLDQFKAFQARVAVFADDDMVVHGNAERLRDLDDRLRHLDVGARRRRISARMVVHQDQCGCAQLQRALITSRG